MTDTPNAYQVALDQLRAERDAVLTRADAAEKERDDLAQKLSGKWIEREIDARLMADIGTGPVAFERNQLRDEVAELRPQVEELRAKLAAAEHRAAMHERDADEAQRAVAVLETVFCAAVRAVARGVK